MPRKRRESGTLPRPLAVLAALVLAGATGLAIRMLPAGATPASTPAAAPAPAPPPPRVPVAVPERTGSFMGFVDTAADPGFDLAAESRRTGVTRYALGHLVAGGDGCLPRWAGPPRPGGDPVAAGLGRLRAAGGDAFPVFGGPGGPELAVACTRPGGLATAYRKAAGAFGAGTMGFEVRDAADPAAVLRRARALRALQQERPLRVCFTLRLEPDGLDAADLEMLRATRRAGARVDTVELLAEMEPRTAPSGRLRRLGSAVRAAAGQLARAWALPGEEQVWARLALTPVLARGGDLDESEAGKLSAYAVRHGLAWLSLRGTSPKPDVSRILWRTHS
ncbi:hypothetical protein ACFFV7_17060 [Nonomuraea spiralis]|uniref:Uncharacterized protein n=1 Tax=Nonomuraea spiralis TaxID=46182 RepID=A0ABV5IG59_9ACTN|nr:hypothetical protein [Nonomuraea spiralis]GGS69258.1 hydrolase [Nonomuraea spiralis]